MNLQLHGLYTRAFYLNYLCICRSFPTVIAVFVREREPTICENSLPLRALAQRIGVAPTRQCGCRALYKPTRKSFTVPGSELCIYADSRSCTHSSHVRSPLFSALVGTMGFEPMINRAKICCLTAWRRSIMCPADIPQGFCYSALFNL